jgi:predicted ATPase
MSIKLITAKILNFKSLGDIELNFRDLTIIVGANSSGKSNCLEALYFLAFILVKGRLPSTEAMPRFVRDNQEKISFSIVVEDDNNHAEYQVFLGLNEDNLAIASEHLLVNGKKVIDIINGKGEVCDEDGKNPQKYESDTEISEELALKSAGKFGNKPFTKKLASYIREWEFYNIDPEQMKKYSFLVEAVKLKNEDSDSIPSLDNEATEVQEILNYWATNDVEKFEQVSKELQECLKISLISTKNNEKQFVKVLEEDGSKMPLSSMSDGTLRIIAYCVLLYQSEIPPLISIEEPERNLHPGVLKDVASIIKRLSRRTQVIFTTHSSQLLDCFETEEISSEISVILLSKKPDCGTKSFLLDKLAESREDLLDWMTDFGVGSAIYHSQLLQEILEN